MRTFLENIFVDRTAFKVCTIIMLMLNLVMVISSHVSGYFKILIVIWGLIIIIVDLCNKRVLLKNRYSIWILAFLLITFISILVNYRTSLLINLCNFGAMVVLFVAIFGYDLTLNRETMEREIKIVANTVVIISFLFGAVCSIFYFADINFSYNAGFLEELQIDDIVYYGVFEGRLYGIYNANDGGFICVISIALSVLLLMMMRHKGARLFYILNIILQFANLTLHQSRSSYVAIAVFIAIFIYYALASLAKKLSKPFLSNFGLRLFTALLCACLVVILISPIKDSLFLAKQQIYTPQEITVEQDPPHQGTTTPAEPSESFGRTVMENNISTGRLELWSGALAAFKEAPLLGVSSGGQLDAVKPHIPPWLYQHLLKGGVHNSYLTVLLASGILGFIALGTFFVLALVHMFQTAWHKRRQNSNYYLTFISLFALIMAILAWECFDAHLFYKCVFQGGIFWIFFGYALFFGEKDREDRGFDVVNTNLFSRCEKKLTEKIKPNREGGKQCE